ncbi:hypothetical protein Hanom_Chr09g00786181 [Helianthus anomalus]
MRVILVNQGLSIIVCTTASIGWWCHSNVAPICAAFCNKAVAEVMGEERVVPPSCKEEGEAVLGLLMPNRLP